MRKVNEAFALPNPIPWYITAFGKFRNLFTDLESGLRSSHPKPVRVSLDRLPLQASIQILNRSKQPTFEAQKPPPSNSRHTWTLTHGFYAVSGGYALQIPKDLPEAERFLPSDTDEIWFLDERLIEFWADHETRRNELPNLSKEEIKSKSKAGSMAKTLVCVQAMWFIMQFITRRAFDSINLDTAPLVC